MFLTIDLITENLPSLVRNMDTLNKIIQVPTWAYDFCYYYLAAAAIVVLYSLYSVYQLFTLPSVVKRFVPVTSTAVALLLSGAITALLAMMQFWVCRSALTPPPPKPLLGAAAPAKKEGFAVKCAATSDCEAVMGTPQGPGCSCGARGLCGGCFMRNDMEPQPSFSGAFDSDYAPM